MLCCAALAFALALYAAPRPDIYGRAGFSRSFLDRQGRVLRITLAPDGAYRIFTPLTALPPELIEATLLYEDRFFFRHPGVNPLSLLRSAVSMALGGRRMGGSTISMQVARLSGKFSTASIPGKLRQIWHALVLERHYPQYGLCGTRSVPLTAGADLNLRIFFDSSSVEVFVNDGEACLSSRIYPQAPRRELALFAWSGSAALTEAGAWQLE